MKTKRPPAPNTQVRDGKIYRFERVDIAESHGILSQSDRPLCGFRDADFQPWHMAHLRYVHPGASEPYRTHHGKESYQQCARIYVEDPRKVPDGVPELPEPWLAYVGSNSKLEHSGKGSDGRGAWFIDYINPDRWGVCKHSYPDVCVEDVNWAIDTRTAFAREHYPHHVEAVGYVEPKSLPSVKRVSSKRLAEAVGCFGAGPTSGFITLHDGSNAEIQGTWYSETSYQQLERELAAERALLDKLADSELKHADGRQEWSVFTDRSDPQMTVREALAAWGGEE